MTAEDEPVGSGPRVPPGLDCAEFVELVTEYLETAMRDADRLRFEAHAGACGGCAAYLSQVETTIRVLRRLAAAEPPAAGDRERILAKLRPWLGRQGAAHAD